MSKDEKTGNNKYDFNEISRPTTAASHKSTTTVKYMRPRTLGLNLSNSISGSLRNFTLANATANLVAAKTIVPANHGLASLVDRTVVRVENEDIHEKNENQQSNQTLFGIMLQYFRLHLESRALELQLESFQSRTNSNCLTIEKMYQGEIETGKQLIQEAQRSKPDLEKKLSDIHQTTLSDDEVYQKLLSKRNAIGKQIFEYQRSYAQNRAEAEFIRSRIQIFNDEIQFYTMKNHELNSRKTRLEYEFNEELYAKQSLEVERAILENEKITNEDIHCASIDEKQNSVDFHQISTNQPPDYFYEQLNNQIRQLKAEYDKRLKIFRDELHRKFEIIYYHSNLSKIRSIPTITQEHEQQIEQYKRERRDNEQEMNLIRARTQVLQDQVDHLEKKVLLEKKFAFAQRYPNLDLTKLEQQISEQEKQLHEALQIRKNLQQQMEFYRLKMHQYKHSKQLNIKDEQRDLPSIIKKANYRSLSQDSRMNATERIFAPNKDFDVEQDCRKLNRIFSEAMIDEMAIAKILCHRTTIQRLQIRNHYKSRYNQSLENLIQTKLQGNSKTLFKILLLSSVERDCYELHRILNEIHSEKNIFVEIILDCSNKEIRSILDYYSKLYGNTIEEDIARIGESSSKRIYRALLEANRPEDEKIDENQISADAQNLFQTNSTWRKDALTFIRILCNRSNDSLRAIFDRYEDFSQIDIEQAVKIDIEPELSRTLTTIIRFVRNPVRYYAYELRKSLNTLNINEDNLTRIIISRCEKDLLQIKSEFEKISKRTLYDQIQTNTQGIYRRLLHELLRRRIESNETNTRTIIQWKQPISEQRSIERQSRCRDQVGTTPNGTSVHQQQQSPIDRI